MNDYEQTTDVRALRHLAVAEALDKLTASLQNVWRLSPPGYPSTQTAAHEALQKLVDACEHYGYLKGTPVLWRAQEVIASLQDDEVERGDHIIVTDEDGDESKWLVVWAHDRGFGPYGSGRRARPVVLACEITRICNCCGVFAPRPWKHRESHTYESGVDLRNPQEFIVDGTTVRKEQVQ